MVKDIKVDAGKSLAIVEYNSGAKYLYSDVDFCTL